VVVSVRLLGDLDGDGDLDADDRAALAARLGRPPTGTNAPFDLNRDGRIDPADLELLEAHLGTRAAARVARADSLPPAVRLWPGYPNPANAQIELVYELPSAQPVALVVSDILGRRVRVLVDQLQEPGIHRLVWDGRDDSGRPAASGVYTALLRAPAAALTQRLVLLR
jgi:hypothetical protein